MTRMIFHSHLRVPLLATLAFIGLLFAAAVPAKGDDLNSFTTRVKTGAIDVSPLDMVSLQIANIAGQQEIEFRVIFLDESGAPLANNSQNRFEVLRPKHSKSTMIRIPSSSGSEASPTMVRAIVRLQGGCEPGNPSSLVIHGTHTSAATGTIDRFSACPIVICSGKSDDDPPAYDISGYCGVHHD